MCQSFSVPSGVVGVRDETRAPAPARTARAAGAVAGAERRLLLDDGEDVARGEDEVLLAGVLDLGAAVLAVDDLVADRDVERDAVAVVVDAARDRPRGPRPPGASPWRCPG